MKYSYLCLLIGVIGFHAICFAQKDSNGLYLNAEDYKNGKLSYGAKCNDSIEKVEIKLTRISNQYYIEVARYNPKLNQFVRLKRYQVYGYKTCEGTYYRFVNNKDYEILNP